MNKLEILLFSLNQYHFGTDIEELELIQTLPEKISLKYGKPPFDSIIRLDSDEIIILDLSQIYNIQSSLKYPHIALLDMEDVYTKIKDRKIINQINKMFSLYEKENFKINKRYFAFEINGPENIANIDIDEINMLPQIISYDKSKKEIWGALNYNEDIYLLLDLKKLLIAKVIEVFSEEENSDS